MPSPREALSLGKKKPDTDTPSTVGLGLGQREGRIWGGHAEGSGRALLGEGGLLIHSFIYSTNKYKAPALCPALFQRLGIQFPPPGRASLRRVQRGSAQNWKKDIPAETGLHPEEGAESSREGGESGQLRGRAGPEEEEKEARLTCKYLAR